MLKHMPSRGARQGVPLELVLRDAGREEHLWGPASAPRPAVVEALGRVALQHEVVVDPLVAGNVEQASADGGAIRTSPIRVVGLGRGTAPESPGEVVRQSSVFESDERTTAVGTWRIASDSIQQGRRSGCHTPLGSGRTIPRPRGVGDIRSAIVLAHTRRSAFAPEVRVATWLKAVAAPPHESASEEALRPAPPLHSHPDSRRRPGQRHEPRAGAPTHGGPSCTSLVLPGQSAAAPAPS